VLVGFVLLAGIEHEDGGDEQKEASHKRPETSGAAKPLPIAESRLPRRVISSSTPGMMKMEMMRGERAAFHSPR